MSYTGGCLCGDVRFEADGEPDRVVHCYCSMCRRQSGAAFLTFARFERGCVRFPSGKPRSYRSSSRVLRGFCERCGSTLTFGYDSEPGHLWLTAGSFDHPEQLHPTRHFLAEECVPWVRPERLRKAVAQRPGRLA